MELRWNPDKDRWLIKNRGLGFAQLAQAMEDGGLLAVLEYLQANRANRQRLLVVEVAGYAWAVPAVADEAGWFLKTAWPSRKLTREYLRKA